MTNGTFATNQKDFRSIMMASKNEEIAEETEKKMRCCNIIIHGKTESTDKDSDDQFITSLIKDLSIGNTPVKSITRLGKHNSFNKVEINEPGKQLWVGKRRPIKIVFNTENDKEKVMNNLRNLKGNAMYTGISITDDYTMSERTMIKEYANRAKEENTNEPENSKYVWRVRGTPKNGLTIKKLMKVKPIAVSKNKTE